MSAFWVFALMLILVSGLCWLLFSRLRVKKGLMRVIERALLGALIVLALSAILEPLGVHIKQSPLTALSTGLFGVSGMIGCFVLQGL